MGEVQNPARTIGECAGVLGESVCVYEWVWVRVCVWVRLRVCVRVSVSMSVRVTLRLGEGEASTAFSTSMGEVLSLSL